MTARWMLILLAALLVAAVLAIGLGSVRIPPGRVFAVLLGRAGGPEAAIVRDLRLPRVALGLAAGAGLAVSGAAYQALFRNPMAEPSVLGVASGAALGGSLAIFFALRAPAWGVGAIPIFAFLGAIVTVALVYSLARGPGGVSTLALLLAGLALSAFFQGVVSALITLASPEVQRSLVFWMAGGLGSATWRHILVAAPYIAAGTAVVLYYARELNLLVLGEEAAGQLGLHVERVKLVLLAAASLATAASVAVTGVIAFVGLMVPHLLRLAVGPDHRRLLPACLLGGPVFVILCDLIGRAAFPPLELRASLISGLLGGPFFLWLLRRRLAGR